MGEDGRGGWKMVEGKDTRRGTRRARTHRSTEAVSSCVLVRSRAYMHTLTHCSSWAGRGRVVCSHGVATRVHAPPFCTRYVTRVFKTGDAPPPQNHVMCHVHAHFSLLNVFAISTWWQDVLYAETIFSYLGDVTIIYSRQSSRCGLCVKYSY
jgi:hypothetical protein